MNKCPKCGGKIESIFIARTVCPTCNYYEESVQHQVKDPVGYLQDRINQLESAINNLLDDAEVILPPQSAERLWEALKEKKL
jgi:uncharacterized Zn finger protein (UPF0148 family)